MLDNAILTSDPKPTLGYSPAPRAILIFACFTIGCVVGAFFGSGFSAAGVIDTYLLDTPLETGGLLLKSLRFVRFHLLVLFLATSFAGVALVPALALIKGFAFSCTSATIISAYPNNGIIMSLIILGLPSLFSVPSFICLCDFAFSRSARLLALTRGGYARKLRDGKRMLLILPALAAGIIIEVYLVPRLLPLMQ